MTAYILRRLGEMIPSLLGVSIAVFLILRLVPGDPARLASGLEANEETIAALRQQLGLNDPLHVQYGRFIIGLATGDLGRSIKNRQPVTDVLASRVPATLELAAASLLVAVVIGLGAGILAALRRGSVFDTGGMMLALLGVSMPSFWLGLMLIFFFAVTLRWLPTSGFGGIQHLVMPAITLGTGSAAIIARMSRAGLIEALSQDYVRTARAKGLPQRLVVMRHALRNAMIPTVTVVGLQCGALLAGSVVTETVFAWPGMGRLLVDSVAMRDYPVIQAIVLLFALIFMVTNLLVDISYALLDPRIRYQ